MTPSILIKESFSLKDAMTSVALGLKTSQLARSLDFDWTVSQPIHSSRVKYCLIYCKADEVSRDFDCKGNTVSFSTRPAEEVNKGRLNQRYYRLEE